MGMVAGCSMLILLASVLLIRKQVYEVFYVMQVALFVLILVAVSIHRSDITLKVLIIVLVAAALWTSDRIIRFIRLLHRSFTSYAFVTPLANDSIRVVVKSPLRQARPGYHVFLWIPAIRKTETHPFTIVSTDPIELVVKTHDGFTKDLLAYAKKHPDAILRASIDGPYGNIPDFDTFDQVILIAGGSGASFTFGVALDLTSKLGDSAEKPIIHFIWVFRDLENLAWFSKELETLFASPLVRLLIHITQRDAKESIIGDLITTPEVAVEVDEKKAQSDVLISELVNSDTTTVCDSDAENSAAAVAGAESTFLTVKSPTHFGRPDIAKLIPSIVRNLESNEKTVVAVCGPQSLMLSTRSVVAGIVGSGNWDVAFHCEQFGW